MIAQLETAHDLAALLKEMYSRSPHTVTAALETLALEERAAVPAVYDEQTGLFTKKYFEKRVLPNALAWADATGQPLCYAMVDIDNFHEYNGRCGHQAGDQAVKDVADILHNNTRHEDLFDVTTPRAKDACVGRIGCGEEFGVLLTTDITRAYATCERLRQFIENTAGVTVSVGVATYEHGLTQEEIIHRADTALYDAKNSGRNQTRVYQPPGS